MKASLILKNLSWFLAFYLLASSLPLFMPTALAEESRYFPQTGKTLSGKFLKYWQENGGLPVFGYPITQAQNELDPETGQNFLSQWFERNRFELHPENAGTKYEILLGLLGKQLTAQRKNDKASFEPVSPDPTANYYQETGHNLKGGFLAYWQQNGGLERFGFPISEEHAELDPETGQVFTMQWFERARFERHPENQPPYDVLLGLLGREIKIGKPVTSSVNALWRLSHTEIKTRDMVADNQGNLYLLNNTLGETFFPHITLDKYNPQGQLVMRQELKLTVNLLYGPLAVDNQANIYVVRRLLYPLEASNDSCRICIAKFDSQGHLLQNLRLNIAPPLELIGLAIDLQNNLYVGLDNTIVKYTSDGQPVSDWRITQSFTELSALALDKENNLYALDFTRAALAKFDSQGHLLFYLDNPALAKVGVAGFYYPLAIMVDDENNLYIEDSDNSTDPLGAFARLRKFSASGQFMRQWPSGKAEVEGQIYQLNAITIDHQGHLLVADEKPYLQKFDLNGNYLGRFADISEQQFSCATAIWLDNQGKLYLYDRQLNRLQLYDRDGHLITNRNLKLPEKISLAFVDRSGNLYVLDDKDRITKYDASGQAMLSFDTGLYNLNPYQTIEAFTVDNEANIYVFYRANYPPPGGGVYEFEPFIYKFDRQGKTVASWKFSTSYQKLNWPKFDIAVDQNQNVYLLTNGYVENYDSTGKLLRVLGNPASVDYPLAGGLALDGQSYIYLPDYLNNRILKFDGQSREIAKWSGADGQFDTPDKLQVDGQGNLYTITGCDVQKLQPLLNPVE